MKTIKITALLIAGLTLSACLNIEGGNRTGAERFVDAGTDSKHYVQLTDTTLRFLPLRLTRDDATRIHGTDERIPVEGYLGGIRFYEEFLTRIGNADETKLP